MSKAVIAYDKDLPEIPGRRPWEKPTQHLVKDESAPTGWAVADGRRPSKLLLVPKIREQVDAWRAGGYEGASDVTRRLFEYWFEEDHEVPGFGVPFRYYFCQREAIETLAWLVEIAGQRDVQKLIQAHATIFKKDLFSDNITFQIIIDGRRQLRRYVPELDAEGVQDLPPENLRRFAFKMATGSGKTWVMAMTIVWARFHKQRVSGSDLSTNFLIVAPNVIVYQRLEKDFAANRIFYELPLIPPEWRGAFSQKVILRGEAAEPAPSGNLFLTNVQQLYESREQEWTPANAIEALLGKKPAKDLAASSQRSMLERVKSLKDLVVLNDEAHHVHDEDLAWSQSLLAIHRALPKGLSLWLDFSATPKDQNGMYFPWTVCDYPLAQAVEDRIVKAPLIVTKEDDPKQPKDDPENVTANNIGEKYGYWLRAAVQRWKEHHKVYRQLGSRPVIFIMAEKNVYADAIGEYLWKTKEFEFKESEVLVIHTDAAGEITKPSLVHDIRKLSGLKVEALDAIYEQEDLAEQFRVKLKLEFATTETEVHQADIAAGELPPVQDLLASITNKVIDRAKLPNRFAELYPTVRNYVATRCFGKTVNLDDEALRSHLARLELQEGIAKYLARRIAELTVERRGVEFDKADFRLSETKPFSWRRNLPPLEAEKTVFNYVATYNDFERRFAEFLDKAEDVVRFASLGTTEQGESGTQFRVDYLKPSGAIGFYHPDWVVVQKTKAGEVNWIIETKGRVWEGTEAKDEAMLTWCERMTNLTGYTWRYLRISQTNFASTSPMTLEEMTR